MSSRYARMLVTGSAAVLVAMPGVAAARAAATWTVRPGGSITLTLTGELVLRDATTANQFTCLQTTMNGTLRSGSGLPGSGIGSVTATSFPQCFLGLADQPFRFTATDLPWHLNAASYNAAQGVVTGTLSHLRITLAGGGCSAVVDGTGATAGDGVVRFTYTDGTAAFQVRRFGGNLHFYDVDGCPGVASTGDPAMLDATYQVTPKQTITSP